MCSMTKFSDNQSEGNQPKGSVDKYKTAKNGLGAGQGSGAMLGELKIENSKNQTFNSELLDESQHNGTNANGLVSN